MDIQERILEKANEQFMRYGLRAVSMDDIANELGMSKKTIYQYFADKDALVDAVLNQEILKTEKECHRFKLTAVNAINEIFLTMDLIYSEFSQMNPLLIYDMEKFYPNVFKKFLKHKNEYIYQVIQDNIERGIEEELYRPEINIEVISKFRLESMMLGFNIEIFPPGRYHLAEVTREIMEHFLFGLTTLKGHKLILKYKEQHLNKNKIHAKA